jgi:hypothetical protein
MTSIHTKKKNKKKEEEEKISAFLRQGKDAEENGTEYRTM